VLIFWPNGLFGGRRALPPEPLTGTFMAPSRPIALPDWLFAALILIGLLAPFVVSSPYVIQTLSNAWLYGMLAISLTLVAGIAGQISLGHAALLAIGGYASALLALDLGAPVLVSIPVAGIITALLGTMLVYPAFGLRGHYVAIATLGIGEIVGLVILNWESLTRGPIGLTGIPPLALGSHAFYSAREVYWLSFVVLVALALLQRRLLRSPLGRTLRAIRDDDVAARAYGVNPNRYKALAFGFSGFVAGVSGAITAHLYSYINFETFTSQISLLALTMAILGGLGNVFGAVVAAVALVGLPEIFRVASDYRMLIYGLALLLLIRFRPQGLFGTV
ncbi:MAG: branched-chain amino acid ABC transporter permease, partial [Bradyrhizobium sp.]|uniref:branched-chain amino acid ABC transporter permease n=1 Tax=Bradyrhizobium sp. TaxID=376 RepID=UPI001D756BA5